MRMIGYAALLLPLLSAAADLKIPVGEFSRGDLKGWEEEVFAGQTHYELREEGDLKALHANSDGTASGLFKEVRVDLSKTPVLHWRWKVNNVLKDVNEQSKPGDDYPARIYVVFSGGLFFWNTRAINYVWSNNQPVGSRWPNAFTGNAMMLAVESGPDKLGRWLEEQRNIAEDYKLLFGDEPGTISAVAIMSDSDNSGQRATAWYGDIYFTAE